MIVASCGSEPTIDASNADTNSLADSSSEQTTATRFDPSASTTWVQYSFRETSDFRELAEWSDIVFVGTLSNVSPNVGEDRGEKEDQPAGVSAVTTYDGITFAVKEVIHGDEGLVDNGQVLISHPTQYKLSEMDSPVLIAVPPVELLAEPIKSIDRAGDQLFIVFANSFRFSDGSDALSFMGPGSIAPIGNDGTTVEATGFSPFLYLSAEDAGYERDVTLDVIRDWIRQGPPESKISEELWPKPQDAPKVPSEELVVPKDN